MHNRHPDRSGGSRPATGLLLVLANFVPLFGALFWGWSILEIVAVYWAENLVIGGFTLLRILAARPHDAIRGHFIGNLFTGAFFTVHYGIFCLVHGVFVFSLLGDGKTGKAVFQGGFLWALLALVLSHGVSFVRGYLLAGDWRGTTAQTQMFAPYPRIVVLHLTILLGAFAVQALGSPVWMLVILVVGKTLLDLALHRGASWWKEMKATS